MSLSLIQCLRALPGFRTRPSLLAGAVLWTTLGIVLLVVQSNLKDRLGIMGFEILGGLASDAGVILMLLGIGLLIIRWRFDRALWPNLATPFIAVGIFALIFGTLGYLSRDDLGDVGAAILVVLFSRAVIAIGTSANRKATTWIATFFLAIGFFFLVDSILGDDTSLRTSEIVLAITGALLAFFGNKFGQALAAKVRGQSSSTN